MRKILFRGKEMHGSREWIYGSYWHFGNFARIILHDSYNTNIICPDTLGQFTGLTDKNGVKIFEGDILELIDDDKDISNYTVAWDAENCRFVIQQAGADMLEECDSWVHEHMTVIGNIYDTPELLEVKA